MSARARWALVGVALTLPACASARYRMPSGLHSYSYYIAGSDSLSGALAAALRGRGLEVVRVLSGGARPTAAVIHFVFRDPGDSLGPVLHVQLADTRTGVVIGAGMALVAGLPRPLDQRAEALLDSLGLGRRPAP